MVPHVPPDAPAPAVPLLQIISPDTYMAMMMQLNRLPPTVEHVCVVLAVPLVYPHLLGTETVLNAFRALESWGPTRMLFKKTGALRVLLCAAACCCVSLPCPSRHPPLQVHAHHRPCLSRRYHPISL